MFLFWQKQAFGIENSFFGESEFRQVAQPGELACSLSIACQIVRRCLISWQWLLEPSCLFLIKNRLRGLQLQPTIKKSENKKNPAFLESVYELNAGHELSEALQISLKEIDNLDIALWNRIGQKTYAEGKWTIHTILQHLIDWERIWCFRAVIFARAEGTIPDAHDQEIMAQNSNANELSIEQLVNELRIVRQSTIMMFDSFNEEILETNCIFFEYEMPLSALGFSITAHQIHHFNIIEERYAPLDR